MTLNEKLRKAVERLGLYRVAARRMETSPAALTRMLQRPEREQTIGQMEDAARSLGLRWNHVLYDPAQLRQALRQLRTPQPQTKLQSALMVKDQSVVSYAAEIQLRYAMEAHHPAALYQFRTHSGREIKVLGWKLGGVRLDDSGDVYEAYWIIWTDLGTWKQPLYHRFDNLLFHDPGSGSTMTSYQDHSHSRMSIHLPEAMGRTYRNLPPQLLVHEMGLYSTITASRDSQGEVSGVELILSDLENGFDPFEQLERAISHLSEINTPSLVTNTTLRERLTWLHDIFGVPETYRYPDLNVAGINVQNGLPDEEIEQAFDDATADAIIKLAREYRVSPEWLLDGVSPFVRRMNANTTGWYGYQIVHQLEKAIEVHGSGQLQEVYLFVEGDLDQQPNEQQPVYAQLAWATQHPVAPQSLVYDWVPALRWEYHHNRIMLKAICRFIQEAAPDVPIRVMKVRDITASLTIPELLGAPETREVNSQTFLSQHGGMGEKYKPNESYEESVEDRFQSFGAPDALARLAKRKP